MDVPIIVMSEEEAREKLNAFLADKHKDTAAQYSDCAAGYKALAEGKTLIHLDSAIRGAGLFESGFPKLAIARADRDQVFFQWRPNEKVVTFDARPPHSRGGKPAANLIMRVDMRREHGQRRQRPDKSWYTPWLEGFAQVPLLPADKRPATGQLRQWFILWEVEQWYAQRDQVEPPHDPMLLEHLQGQLYAVLAEWELTDLERAVMDGALRAQG